MPANVSDQIALLRQAIEKVQLPPDLKNKTLERLSRIERIGETTAGFDELDRTIDYINWLINLPWNKRSEDNLDLAHAKQVLDKNHYGLEDIKDRILEYIAVIKLNTQKQKDEKTEEQKNNEAQAPILCFVGLAGTGKTTFATSVAEALGRQFYRIPLGGVGDVLDLRGQSKMHPEAEPGLVIKALHKVQTKNPVLLIDEIDRVDERGRAAIMGALLELLDHEQNQVFVDHYIDWPFDLSEVLFVTTANNTTNISTAVLDRLEVIHMPSYSDEQKIMIGKSYMLPKVVEQSGLPRGVVTIDDGVWANIVRPLGYDSGMRTLERTIEGIVRKAAREYVEGKIKSLHLTSENLKQYLPTW